MKTSTKVILGAVAAAAAVAATRKAIEAYNGASFDSMTGYSPVDGWSPVPDHVARELRIHTTNYPQSTLTKPAYPRAL